MTGKKREQYWVVTDSASSFTTSDFLLSGKAIGFNTGAYCRKRTLSGGRQSGVEIIEISNGIVCLNVCPTRGMAIIDGSCRDHHLGWSSPVKEIVHPQYINLYDLGGRGCHYGFNEMLNRCGIEWSGAMGEDTVIDNKGRRSSVFLPLHGKVGWTPASKVVLKISDDAIVLEGEVPEQNVFGVNYLLKTSLCLRSGSSSMEITDTLCNLGPLPGEYEMLYHTNFGPPFLEKGSRYYGNFSRMVPRDEFGQTGMDDISMLDDPAAGFIEQVYLFKAEAGDDGLTHQLLTNASRNLAIHVAFDPSTLPYTILWKRTASEEEGYVVGLNPCTDLPNNRSIEREQNRVARIDPYGEVVFKHSVSIIEGEDSVTELARRIGNMSGPYRIGEAGDFDSLTK